MSSQLDYLFSLPQFSIPSPERDALLLEGLKHLTAKHLEDCVEYARVVHTLFPDATGASCLSEIPYLPVALFKRLKLSSVSQDEIFKTLRSSGTTGTTPSRIILDRETARLQVLGLKHIMSSFLGPKRLPMLVIDSEAAAHSSGEHSARAAGVIGMMSFGRDHFFALDSNEQIQLERVQAWLETYKDEPIFVFGFTAIVWHRFFSEVKRMPTRSQPVILVHGGGWKKLIQLAVSSATFKARAAEVFGSQVSVHDYYGMVEQVGSIHVECQAGFLHTPNFASVLVRDYRNLQVLPPGHEGIVQVVSLLPRSYPGHSILTEDIGVLQGPDNCPCGRRGAFFTVRGRLARAELRGCSDTANVG